MSTHPLTPLFEPRSIAVVRHGEARSLAREVLENIRRAGFAGEVFAIEVDGAEAPKDLASLPRGVELVVICAAGSEPVPALLAQCVQRRAHVAMLVSASQGELDDHAERLLADAVAQVRSAGLRVVGPRCLGVMRSSSKLNASFSRGIGRAGTLALISQSAGVCEAVLDWATAHNIGFSTVASLGAAADVSVGEVLDYLALEGETRAVLLYLAGADHPRRFMSGLRALARIKPVVVVKAGRYGAESRTDQDAVFDAALRRGGAVRVPTLAQLFSTADLLAHAPRIAGERLAVLTNAAGLGVLAADRARDVGLPLATWSAQTALQLQPLSQSRAAADNPLDLGAEASADDYARGLELCLAEVEVDGVLVLFSPQLASDAVSIAHAIAKREVSSRKAVLASFVGGPQVVAARDKLIASGVPTFSSPEAAVDAFRHLASFQRNRELLMQAPDVFSSTELDVTGARLIIEAALSQRRAVLSQREAKAILSAFRIAVTPSVLARDPNEAMVAAQQIGFPVALKIDSPDVTDKSAAHGVRLNLAGAAEVRSAYRELTAEVTRVVANARIDGVTVEPMRERREGREIVVTIHRDLTFGPVIALGAPSDDRPRAFALPPLNTRLALDLIEQTGRRAGRPQLAADSGELVKLLLRLSDLACELPEVRELAIDPLLVEDAAVVALDVRIGVQHVPASQCKYAQLAIAPYPRELVEVLQLSDGTPILLRPIRPEDTQLEQDLVRDLSLESRRFRFMHALSRLTDDMLVRFTQLDYDREIGLIAVQATDAGEIPLGVARYVGDSDELGCEFAVVVADAWQKRGVASQLMRALISAARSRRFAQMHGDVLADNTRMLQWMQRLGFKVAVHPDDATLRIVTLAL
jgi:acetyltransferase